MSNPLNQSEKEVERECVKYAKSLGWKFRKQQGQGQRGKTDRFFMKNGITVFVEFKRPGGEPTVKQYNEINNLREDGFIAEWFDSIRKFKECLLGIDSDMEFIAANILKRNTHSHSRARVVLEQPYTRKS